VGRVSGRRAPADEATRVIELYATRYFDYNAKHFHEKLVAEHRLRYGYTWTKRVLQDAGQLQPLKRRGPHRKKRERKPLPGMMLHQDGSRHSWVADEQWDLIVTMDDATSEIYSAFFVEEEGTMSSFQALLEVIGGRGLFGALYADRGSHYWYTPNAGKGVDYKTPTQVRRALDQLGVTLIPARSPEARGRSERMFGTLQGRLPQELRSAGITTMEAANRYLREVFLPAGVSERLCKRFRGHGVLSGLSALRPESDPRTRWETAPWRRSIQPVVSSGCRHCGLPGTEAWSPPRRSGSCHAT
jgi:hypothetical protein